MITTTTAIVEELSVIVFTNQLGFDGPKNVRRQVSYYESSDELGEEPNRVEATHVVILLRGAHAHDHNFMVASGIRRCLVMARQILQNTRIFRVV
jgi:hypothetical protein